MEACHSRKHPEVKQRLRNVPYLQVLLKGGVVRRLPFRWSDKGGLGSVEVLCCGWHLLTCSMVHMYHHGGTTTIWLQGDICSNEAVYANATSCHVMSSAVLSRNGT